MSRVTLNFNRPASDNFVGSTRVAVKRAKNPNPFLPTAKTLIRPVNESNTESYSLYDRTSNKSNLLGTKINGDVASQAGIGKKKKYVLKNAGNGWYWMVPAGNINKTNRGVRSEEPMVTAGEY